MTFTVDTCIALAIANKFDFFHKRSRKLLERREDDLIILFSVMHETQETFIRKFNQVSKKLYLFVERAYIHLIPLKHSRKILIH